METCKSSSKQNALLLINHALKSKIHMNTHRAYWWISIYLFLLSRKHSKTNCGKKWFRNGTMYSTLHSIQVKRILSGVRTVAYSPKATKLQSGVYDCDSSFLTLINKLMDEKISFWSQYRPDKLCSDANHDESRIPRFLKCMSWNSRFECIGKCFEFSNTLEMHFVALFWVLRKIILKHGKQMRPKHCRNFI